MPRFKKIAFVASPTGYAREAAAALMRRYDVISEICDAMLALAGVPIRTTTRMRTANSR